MSASRQFDAGSEGLASLRAAHRSGDAGAHAAAVSHILRVAEQFMQDGRYCEAVAFLDEARQADTEQVAFTRPIALALGAAAERVLRWADSAHVPPPDDVLDLLERDLRRATEIDPALADPFWDLAVIAARFRGDREAATRYLGSAKSLGYRHPLVQRLEALLDSDAPLPTAPDGPGVDIRQELVRLAHQACSASEPWLHDDQHTADGQTPWTFGAHVQHGLVVLEQCPPGAGEWPELIEWAAELPGDAREYVLDLLRRLADNTAADPTAKEVTTAAHLDVLRQSMEEFLRQGDRTGEAVWFRRTRRAARRALAIVDDARTPVDPDLHADLLLSAGSALWRLEPEQVVEVLRFYRSALALKRAAWNVADAARLAETIATQAEHRMGRAHFAVLTGGFGEALETLAAFVEALEETGDEERTRRGRLVLASVQRQIGMYESAEPELRRLVAESASDTERRNALFELASVLSETQRPSDALIIHEELLASSPADAEFLPALYSNYANDLRLLGRFEEARDALDAAWRHLPQERRRRAATAGGGERVPLEAVRIRSVQAQVAHALGDLESALRYIEEAEALNPVPTGVDGLYQLSLKAEILLAVGRREEALDAQGQAHALMRVMLAERPSLPAWESMLRRHSGLESAMVHTALTAGGADRFDRAVLAAEASKGRVVAWLEQWADPDYAAAALDPERAAEALDGLRAWLSGAGDRRFVSLSAHDGGLAVLQAGPDGMLDGCWVSGFGYESFRTELFEPWERLVERAMTGGVPDDLAIGAALTDHLLDRIGAWLVQAAPDLERGGSTLLISPHRALRNLPLLHARLPSGRRLSELYDAVRILPTLASFDSAPVSTPGDGTLLAFADPDGTLPFARCEAWLAAGNAAIVGEPATRESLSDSLRSPCAAILLSAHGDFVDHDPFASVIETATAPFRVSDLLLHRGTGAAPAVVLGVCESGRSRRSTSDEPLGFPMMLLQAGVGQVVAPCWRIDDFASFLWMTHFTDALRAGTVLDGALIGAAAWLRDLTAANALTAVGHLVARLRQAVDTSSHDAAVEVALAQLDAQLAWLHRLPAGHRPFASPLDWAAFQIVSFRPPAP